MEITPDEISRQVPAVLDGVFVREIRFLVDAEVHRGC
jgi:hypothetical protein